MILPFYKFRYLRFSSLGLLTEEIRAVNTFRENMLKMVDILQKNGIIPGNYINHPFIRLLYLLDPGALL